MEIIFEEHKEPGYVGRTVENASADVTVAIACTFTSPGEILTKKAALDQGKIYVPIDIKESLSVRDSDAEALISALNSAQKNNILDNLVSLNIAGNGMFTMKNRYTQEALDEYTFELLKKVISSPNLKVKVSFVRTGGQTGLDESGAKAAIRLGIPTLVMCPKGWLYRDAHGRDITDEELFKRRFVLND